VDVTFAPDASPSPSVANGQGQPSANVATLRVLDAPAAQGLLESIVAGVAAFFGL
jgi:hypothetical protein